MGLGSLFSPMLGTVTSGLTGWFKYVILAILGLGVIFAVVYFWNSNKKDKKKWNKTVRVWQEDKTTGKIPLNPYVIKAKGITLNGSKYIFLNKPLMGSKLIPLLNHYTKPGLYDLIVTADNRFFLMNGITNIDKKRKELGVGLRYPGIDHQFDEINQKYASMNKTNNFDRTMEIIKKLSQVIFPIILLIALIVGGNYFVKWSKNNADQSKAQLQVMQQINTASASYKEGQDTMVIILNQLKQLTGNSNLQEYVSKIKSSESG